jgi:hypothetical protein
MKLNKCVAGFAMLLTACSYSAGNKNLGSQHSVEKFMSAPGVAKSDIVREFGEPGLTFEKDGMEVYEYKRVVITDRMIAYIPVAALATHWIGSQAYDHRDLYVYFDKNDGVAKYAALYDSGKYKRKK